ncbi:MAG: hypothetical protein ABIS01_03990 [Ferruginibacter sp.]
MKRYRSIAIAILVLLGCSQNAEKNATITENNGLKTDSFFPVTSFIKGQMIILDSLPVTPLRLTSIKGNTDSVWLTKTALKQQLQSFLTPAINETGLTKYFKETKFNDQTLNTVTFTYEPIIVLPASITLRHWDVYINPQTGTVTKVYIVKAIKKDDQLFTQQLTWQTDKLAKISTFLNKPDETMNLLKEVVFIWKFD